jgi:type II secretory pathway component PulC
MMTKKFFLINVLLILIVVFLAVENYDKWTKPASVGKESASSRQRTTAASFLGSAAGKREVPALAQFRLISDKNIFSPDRKEFPIPLLSEVKKPPVRPNLQLFGVVIGEGFQSAVINNPTRRADRGERETMTVKEGEKVGEYTVAKVLPDRITLESTGDTFDVLLYDPTKQKRKPVVTPAPSPPPVSPGSPVPPRPYTPPAATPPRATPPPAVVNPPTPQGGFPGRNLTRSPMPQRRIPAPPARTPAVPVPEEDDEDDEEI